MGKYWIIKQFKNLGGQSIIGFNKVESVQLDYPRHPPILRYLSRRLILRKYHPSLGIRSLGELDISLTVLWMKEWQKGER